MDLERYNPDFKKVVSHFEQELRSLQVWRASTWLIEWIDVFMPEWGQTQKIKAMWSVTIMDSQTIKIECWDKSNIANIEKAIYDADIWLAPVNQGDRLMIKIPQMTQDRRIDLIKVIKKKLEESKVAIRNVRQVIHKEFKQQFENKEIAEDEKKWLERKLDEIVKKFNTSLDDISKIKEEDIMKI